MSIKLLEPPGSTRRCAAVQRYSGTAVNAKPVIMESGEVVGGPG